TPRARTRAIAFHHNAGSLWRHRQHPRRHLMTIDRRSLLKLGAASAAGLALPFNVFAQSGSELLIGGLVPITGAGAPYGSGMLKAMEIAVQEVNDAGGAAGRK